MRLWFERGKFFLGLTVERDFFNFLIHHHNRFFDKMLNVAWGALEGEFFWVLALE